MRKTRASCSQLVLCVFLFSAGFVCFPVLWFCVFSCSVVSDTYTLKQRRFILASVLTGFSVHSCEQSSAALQKQL